MIRRLYAVGILRIIPGLGKVSGVSLPLVNGYIVPMRSHLGGE